MKPEQPLTPPPALLAMPTQSLAQRPGQCVVSQDPSTWLARLLVFGGGLTVTAAASQQMYLSLPMTEATAPWIALQLWLLLGLFTLTFGWISLSATTAAAGLLLNRNTRGSGRPQQDTPLQGKTALVMPIYNEDAASACAALAAMADDLAGQRLKQKGLKQKRLQQKGVQQHFEIFILSDTNAPDRLPAEVAAVQRLRAHLSDTLTVSYRRREHNTERKAGNIRDFVERWGNRYDYMVVLDADSLIAGDTLVTLVREMDADPSTGLLQTLPRLCGGETLFARLQQFAAAAYGPVFARGLSAWQGHDGNYWGHNAIIRIRAFADCAGLPTMRGRLPFGGEIRSHDFVEAALIRRAGWSVRMLPELAGSWEECPPTLQDASIRDRRWAQGNVQHLAVVSARGLRWPNRVHMLMGAMNYLTSLLWLGMITMGLALSAQFALHPGTTSAGEAPGLFDAERIFRLLIVSMALLLFPKLIGLAEGLLSRNRRGGAGRVKFFLSAILELLFSILLTPILMLIHSRHLWEIARGQDSGWSTQRRQPNNLKWRTLFARHGVHTALGLLLMGLLLVVSPALLYWVLPITIGLVLAIPLAALSGSRTAGHWCTRRGLLRIAEESTPPAVMTRRQALVENFSSILKAGPKRSLQDDKRSSDIPQKSKHPEPASSFTT